MIISLQRIISWIIYVYTSAIRVHSVCCLYVESGVQVADYTKQVPVTVLTIQRRYRRQQPTDESALLPVGRGDSILFLELYVRVVETDILLSKQR